MCIPAGRAVRAAPALLGVLALVLAAAGCGGPSAADIASLAGTWERVEAGEPNADFTLTVATAEDGADVTFANHAGGTSETVAATMEHGSLACVRPAGDALFPYPATASASGVPAGSALRLSLDEGGQLVVDLVLPDGTLEPVGIYERASASGAAEP